MRDIIARPREPSRVENAGKEGVEVEAGEFEFDADDMGWLPVGFQILDILLVVVGNDYRWRESG